MYIARLLLLGFATWPFEGSRFLPGRSQPFRFFQKVFSLRIQELGRIKRSAKTARKVGKHFFSVYSYIDCRLTFQTVKISLLKWCPFCDLLYLPACVNLVRLWVSGSVELTGSNAWLTLEEGYVIDNSYGPLSPRLYNYASIISYIAKSWMCLNRATSQSNGPDREFKCGTSALCDANKSASISS